MDSPILNEVFADNGAHSHWELLDSDGNVLWTQSDEVSPSLSISERFKTGVRDGIDGWQAWFSIDHQKFYLQPVAPEALHEEDTEEKARWFEENLKFALNRLVMYSDWVSTKDRLPTKEDTSEYYYWSVMAVDSAYKTPKFLKWYEIKDYPWITHWMQIPQQPSII